MVTVLVVNVYVYNLKEWLLQEPLQKAEKCKIYQDIGGCNK